MSLEEIIRSATSRAGIVRVRNALNPILWTCAVASPLCFGFAYAFGADPILRYGLAGLGTLPIILTLAAYIYFMFRNPDRLQSEEFVLRQQELTIIERKSGPPISLDGEAADGAITTIENKTARPQERQS